MCQVVTSHVKTRCSLDGVESPFLDTEERTRSLQAGMSSELRQEVEHGALSRTGSGISVHQQASAHHLNLEVKRSMKLRVK